MISRVIENICWEHIGNVWECWEHLGTGLGIGMSGVVNVLYMLHIHNRLTQALLVVMCMARLQAVGQAKPG